MLEQKCRYPEVVFYSKDDRFEKGSVDQLTVQNNSKLEDNHHHENVIIGRSEEIPTAHFAVAAKQLEQTKGYPVVLLKKLREDNKKDQKLVPNQDILLISRRKCNSIKLCKKKSSGNH
jgi:hypothetical protein